MGLTGETLRGLDRTPRSASDVSAPPLRRSSDLPYLLSHAIQAALGEEHES